MKGNRMLRTIFSVSGVIFLAKLLGFVKQAVTASTFGATIATDLISLSEDFIENIQYVLVQVLLSSFTTIYIHVREKGEEQARGFAMNAAKAFSLIALGLSAVVLLGAPLISRIIAPSYSPELSSQLTGYLRLFAPTLVLFVWIAVFHALLNANRRFIPGELTGLNQSVIVIALVLAFRKTVGVQILVLAFFIYHIWNTLYLGALSRRYWGRSRGNPFQNKEVRQLLRMACPLLLGYSMVYINQQVDKALSSGLEQGTVTAMGYAAVLSNLVGTFIGSFCSILFTDITIHISRGEDAKAAELATRAAALLVLAVLPVSLLTILCAEDVVTIVYGRGAFDAAAVNTAAQALRGYAFSFIPLVLRDLFSRFQYGYQDTRRPMVNSTISIALNIALSITLCPWLGVFGITLASSVSMLACGVLNAVTARRHSRVLSFRPLLKVLPWMAAGGLLCVFAAQWGLRAFSARSSLVRFALTALLGFGAYFPAAALPLRGLLRTRKSS